MKKIDRFRFLFFFAFTSSLSVLKKVGFAFSPFMYKN